jgi:poly(A) polymerase
VTAGRGISQPRQFHAFDVFGHALAAVDAMDVMLAASRPSGDRAWMWDVLWRAFSSHDGLRGYVDEEMSEGRTRRSLLKLAALLHDVAKPQTRTVDADGRIRFLGHADEGAEIAAAIMRRLRFSARESSFVATIVREHLRPVQLAQLGEVPSDRALYRFHRDTGDALVGVILLALSDGAAAAGDRLTDDGWARQAAYMNSLIVRLQGEGGIVHAPRLLTGRDIMSEFGLAEGPRIGELLESLREAQAAGEVRDRESALTFVRAQLT